MKKILLAWAALSTLACSVATAGNKAEWRDLVRAGNHTKLAISHLTTSLNRLTSKNHMLIEVKASGTSAAKAMREIAKVVEQRHLDTDGHASHANELLNDGKKEIDIALHDYAQDALGDFKQHTISALDILREAAGEIEKAKLAGGAHH